MGGNQTGRLRLGGILSNAKGNQSPRRKPEPHPTESANPGTPAPGTTHRPATRRHPGQRQVLNRRKHGRRNLSQPVLAAFRQNRKKSSHLRKPSMDAAHHMRSPARHQSDRTGTIKKTRQHAAARQSGLDIRGTRSEQAVSIANQMDISRETLLALGAQADYAAFSGNFVNEEHVQQYWRDIAQERKYMLKSLPTLRRWRAKLSLADVFHFRSNRSGRNNGSDRKHNRKKGRDS